jgi:CMP-N-acetylneuraminic acid synthetase|tara:strand:+ start:375 stop:1055 length:681 start_codon:yes stop_codon:yes gene_type:complete
MTKKKIIAIIPARGNSNRLKNKNLKKFNGHPLIHWTIVSALKSKFINSVLVSSDSKKILDYCSKYKSVVLSKRPKKFSLKNSKIEDAIINEIKRGSLSKFDYFILLQPTSPLRTLKTINDSIKLTLKKKASTCVSFYKIKNNFLNIFEIKNIKILEVERNLSTSSKSKFFIPSGDIYISSIKKFVKNKSFINKNTIPYLIKNKYSDIDYLHEFKLAEKIQKSKIFS